MLEIRDGESLSILKPIQRILTGYVDYRNGDVKEIRQYHRTFKQIMDKMLNSDAGYFYASEVLDRCIWLIIHKELGKALLRYKFMVDHLKKQYNV